MDLEEEPVTDFKGQTLEWAASMEGSKPSARLEFLKNYIRILTSDELHRLIKMCQNTKRRVCKEEKLCISKGQKNSQESTEAATSSFDAANSSVDASSDLPNQPWWNKYSEKNILAWDTEQVSCPKPADKCKKANECEQLAATVDVVDSTFTPVFSRTIFHKTGSFKVNPYTLDITGFTADRFDDPTLPKIEVVQKEANELFRKKTELEPRLVVTCGGVSDYQALNLTMSDYDVFDLQSHWYTFKEDEHGVKRRKPHSLRSLASHYSKDDIQSSTHSSLDDAIATMKLFHIYKKYKVMDDPENLDKKLNEVHHYNEIPVLESATRVKFKKKKQQARLMAQKTLHGK